MIKPGLHYFGLDFILFIGFQQRERSCGKDLVALGRHQWQCTQRVHRSTTVSPLATDTVSRVRKIDVASIKCYCGKSCKGIKGLRIHEKSCRIVKNLGEEESTIDQSYCETEEYPVRSPFRSY